jgi:antitoxin component YwqK of YwqJK toxin-antitoxin module
MKAFVTAILFFSLTLAAFGQSVIDSGRPHQYTLEEQTDSGFTNKTEASNQLIDGVKEGKWVEYYKIVNGDEVIVTSKHAPLYRLTIYKDNKPHGLVREYSRKGKLWSKIYYVRDKLNKIEYFANGTMNLKDSIMDSDEHGIIKTYFKDGHLGMQFPFKIQSAGGTGIHIFGPDKHSEYILKGTVHGSMKLYYDSSSTIVWMEYPYMNDSVSDSVSTIEFGNPGYKLTVMVSALFKGAFKMYYKSGKLESAVGYINGKLTVQKEYYDKTGVVESEVHFKNWQLDGIDKEYDKDGHLESEIPFVDGKITGVVRHYYPSGKVKTEATFQENEIVGTEKLYDESGVELK